MSRWSTEFKPDGSFTAKCKLCQRVTNVKLDLARCPRHCEEQWEKKKQKAFAKVAPLPQHLLELMESRDEA